MHHGHAHSGEDRAHQNQRALTLALIGNLTSATLKVIFGLLANSIAMVADAVHSILDSSSSILGIYGNRVASRPPDREHPYGYGKFEYVVALGITLFLFLSFFTLLSEAIQRLLGQVIPNLTLFTFMAIIVSMGISLTITSYERKVGKKTRSPILMTDAAHTLTDVFSSVVVIVGFVAIRLGFGYADSLAAIVVCSLMGYIGISLFRENAAVLMDRGISQEVLSKVKDIAQQIGRDIDCHSIRGRTIGAQIYLDMHVTFKKGTSIEKAHRITEKIERRLREEVKGVREAVIHVEPEGSEQVCQEKIPWTADKTEKVDH